MAEQARLARNLEVVEANVKMFNQIMEDTDIPGTEDARGKSYVYSEINKNFIKTEHYSTNWRHPVRQCNNGLLFSYPS